MRALHSAAGLMLMLSLLNTALAATYNQPCAKDSDCDTGICNVYFVDTTPTMNSLQATMGLKEAAGANPGASTRKGICVECKTECDCEANQFCDTDVGLVIPGSIVSSNTGQGATAYAKALMAAYGLAFGGMPLRGKCRDLGKIRHPWATWPWIKKPTWDIPSSTGSQKNQCINPATVSPSFQLENEFMVDEVMHKNSKFDFTTAPAGGTRGKTVVYTEVGADVIPRKPYDVAKVGETTAVNVKSVRKPRTFPTKGTSVNANPGTEDKFCGKVAQFAPAFYATAGALKFKTVNNADRPANSEYLSTGNFYNTPAACPKWVNHSRTTCNRCYDCDSARDPCAWSKKDYKVYPVGGGEMLTDGTAAQAKYVRDDSEYARDGQRGKGLDFQPWSTFYLDATKVSDAAPQEQTKSVNGFQTALDKNNPRKEGVTRDMCEECSMLCNRYTDREEEDYGIFQYDNMLDFDETAAASATENAIATKAAGYNPYAYAKYPHGQDSPFEEYAEDCYLNPHVGNKETNPVIGLPSRGTDDGFVCPTTATTTTENLLSWHATQKGVKSDISKTKNRELFTGKHASSFMPGSKTKQAKWTRHSDHKLCMMKCYMDRRYDAQAGGEPLSNDCQTGTTCDATNNANNVRAMFNRCADKEVDIVVGPGGYIRNEDFYKMRVNKTYDAREYGIGMMEEREGAPLGCNDGLSSKNSFQTFVHHDDGTKSISSTDAVFNVGGFHFHSPVILFQGHCEQGTCRICKEDSRRCLGENGASQTCVHGVWVRSSYLKAYNDRSFQYDPDTKLLAAICIFLIIIILLFFLAILIYCCCNRQEYIPVHKVAPPAVQIHHTREMVPAPTPPPIVHERVVPVVHERVVQVTPPPVPVVVPVQPVPNYQSDWGRAAEVTDDGFDRYGYRR